jgi:hypothetical protein
MTTKRKYSVDDLLHFCGIRDESVISFTKMIMDEDRYADIEEKNNKLYNLTEEILNTSRVLNIIDYEKIREMGKIVDSMVKPMQESTEQVINKIMDAQEKIKRPDIKFNLEHNKSIMWKTQGLATGSYVFSADSQIGKTGFVMNLCADALLSNMDSKLIYVSLDDSQTEIVSRLICAMCFRLSVDTSKTDLLPDINCVNSGYSYWDDKRNEYVRNDTIELIKSKGTEVFNELVKKNRIIIVNGEHSMASLDSVFASQSKKNTLVVLDAIYNIKDDFKVGLDKDEKISRMVKMLPVKYGATAIAIKEIVKGTKEKGAQLSEEGERKRNKVDIADTKGSVIWEYNCNVMGTLYDYKGKLAVNIQKNKITGKKFVRYYDFNPYKNAYKELDLIVKTEVKK